MNWMFLLPWSPEEPAGVSIVVRSLMEKLPAVSALKTSVTVLDWNARRPVDIRSGGVRFSMALLGGTDAWAIAKSIAKAPYRLWIAARYLKEKRVAVANFHYPGLPALTVALLRQFGIFRGKLVLSFHGTDVQPPSNHFSRIIWRCIFTNADAVTACSHDLANRVVTAYGLAPGQVVAAYNG